MIIATHAITAEVELDRARINCLTHADMAAELNNGDLAEAFVQLGERTAKAAQSIASVQAVAETLESQLIEARMARPIDPLAQLLDRARAQTADRQSLAGMFDNGKGWRGARILRRVNTARDIKFEAGDVALVRPQAADGTGYVTAWSFRTATRVSVRTDNVSYR